MVNLKINSTHICKLPSIWKELTGKEIKALCKFLTKTVCPESLKAFMLFFVAKLKVLRVGEIHSADKLPDKTLFAMKSKKKGLFYASSADVQALVNCFSFLFSEKDGKLYLESGIVQNYFPRLRTKLGYNLYGPSSGLFNISFAEFIRMETLYEALHSDQSPDAENRFCGTLYRRKDPKANPKSPSFNGDIRTPFNDHLAKTYSRNGKWLPKWKKVYVRLFYEGCRNFIINKFEKAFYSDGPSSAGEGLTTFENFNKLVTGLCDGDLTKADLIRKAPLYDAFSQLEALAVQNKKMRESVNKKPVY